MNPFNSVSSVLSSLRYLSSSLKQELKRLSSERGWFGGLVVCMKSNGVAQWAFGNEELLFTTTQCCVFDLFIRVVVECGM